MKFTFIPMLHLQLFAEGGDGGTAQGQGVTAGAASQQTGVKGASLADVQYGVQPQESAPAAEVQQTTDVPPDLNAEFEKLIKGQYKEQYGAKVQETIRRRMNGVNETVKKYEALTPTLEILGKKYGVDANDTEALIKAIQNDDSYFEQEAMERGISVKELKVIKQIERENADLRRQMQEHQTRENADKLYAGWIKQEQDVKNIYPAFDMKAEMQNPEFVNLLRANVDLRTAYEVLHRDEIIPAAMQFAAKTVEQNISKKIAANGARPSENGAGSQAPAVVKSDVSKLTKQDIDEVARRVARGERVTFG